MTEVADTTQIEQTLKDYILAEFLPGENPDELTPTTPLTGVLDSIATLSMVNFIEGRYQIELQPHELNNLGSIREIADLIASKM